jgi:WXG100 family type VII secretion target
MSGSPFSVDYASVQAAAQDVRSARSEVDGDLKALAGVVNDLACGWQGTASTTYQNVMGRWNNDATKLLDALDRIADLLVKTANEHQSTEEQQQGTFAAFNDALNG